MIEYPGPKFRTATAGAFKEAVIYDKSVDPPGISQRLDRIGDFFGKQGCKPHPIDPAVVQEPVVCILGKTFPEGSGLLLHVHAALLKSIAELVLEEFCD